MFEDLFARPSTVEHYRCSPLINERLAFLDHCEQLGIKPATLRKIAAHQLKLVRLLDLNDDEVNARRIEAGFRRWLLPGRCRLRPKFGQRFLSCSKRWLRFLGWLEEPRVVGHGHTSHVTAFATSMSGERGWSDTTIDSCCRTVDRFFVGLDEAGLDLASVEITTIDEAITRYHARGYARSTIHLYAQQLRTFFRFAEQQGWCSPGLADGIMPPRRHPGKAIPKGLNRDEVIRLLASTEGDRSCDIRARAIVMLLITYGLRAGEVSGLRLDDLAWEREMLRVRCPKPGRTLLYPLSRGVGQAILRYLREVRPVHAERRLFLTLKAPIKPLSRGVIKSIVSIRLERLGITDKRRGPHALRHAAAQHLLDRGLSMKAVGDYLGHRSVAATAVYAQVQLHALREVANIDLEGLT